ncbi:putative aminotransferase [Luteitalea sp. TBR-22]|nr:putative aminotransferase [Luteitalea sp. TBR-22]
MPPLTSLPTADLAAFHADVTRRYDAFTQRGLALDLTRGKPSSEQLDLSNGLLGLPGEGDYLAADRTDTRNYGLLQGLPELRAIFAPLFGAPASQIVIGDNSSLALMHDAVAYSLLKGTVGSPRPWVQEERVTFLCPVPGYDRHFAICQDFGIRMIPVPLLADGPDMDVVEKLVLADASIKGMWCVPKYANPSGAVYAGAVVERLASMKTAAPDFRLFWDNAYAVHHLTEERVEIPSLIERCAAHGNADRAFVFGSTSKITLAGAGVSLFAGSPDNVKWFLGRMGKRTIGSDKVNQLRHVRFLKDADGLLALMDRHRAIMAPKFEAVSATFAEHLAGTGVASWLVPKGGYFISLDVMDGCAKALVQAAKAAGVELTPAGATHPLGQDPDDRTVRIAPSFPDLATVKVAAEGVALSVLLVTSRALLAQRGEKVGA